MSTFRVLPNSLPGIISIQSRSGSDSDGTIIQRSKLSGYSPALFLIEEVPSGNYEFSSNFLG
jgi:hypothetical protein